MLIYGELHYSKSCFFHNRDAAITIHRFCNIFLTRKIILLCSFITGICLANDDIVFVTESLPPLQYLEDGHLKGKYAQVINHLIQEAGLNKAKVEVYPWARAYKMALERKNTFIFSIVRTPEREDKFIWVQQLGSDSFGFYGRRPVAQYSIDSLQDAKNWLTVVLRQDLVYETLTSLGFEERRHLIVGSDLDSVFRVFFSGRADLIVTNEHLFDVKVRAMGEDPQKWGVIWTVPQLTRGYYLAANKQTEPAIIKRLQQLASQ